MRKSFSAKNIKRATVFVALFFSYTGFATTETYRDIIEKSYNLSLQKDRSQAMIILMGAFKREKKNSAAQKDLAAAIDQVSKVFYSDKAQQLYELALSLRTTDPATAHSKLQDAARLEPDNISIEVAVARQLISNGDCDGAQSRIFKQKEYLPAIEELRLVFAQAQLCGGKTADYQSLRQLQDLKQSAFPIYWQVLESEYYFRTGAFSKALESAMASQKLEPGFPEALYWQWKSEVELKAKPVKTAQKYLNLCKTLNSRQQREYFSDPQLCRRASEVETFLKKNNNSDV